ncbi:MULTISPECIES: hypothetical protein [Bacillaceae]|uniref:Uncharacterized protein n=1 Tax=Evansella alkalicola TaxID=745819 RepID=A0ABS6JQ65_9BACI|nr:MULTISPECIES: hypothetical protein [Bacillaceae]MBU9720633.1 hypothetical protein [Bacillus alkalicola]
MFDPTIFDNLKVVLEGNLYDRDFSKRIKVIGRKDIVDLAVMSREFVMQFQELGNTEYPMAELKLISTMKDFSSEMILGDPNSSGCTIYISYYTVIKDEDVCRLINNKLDKLWNGSAIISQELSYIWNDQNKVKNKITLDFNRKINEDQIDDIPRLIDMSIESLQLLKD